MGLNMNVLAWEFTIFICIVLQTSEPSIWIAGKQFWKLSENS